MKKCKFCGRKTEKEIFKGGNTFCSPACLKKYEEENNSDSDDVCEFC